tara:strand:- start:48 stop:284 length:237 start_codon:yes stop_codon:yes gene_type:complete
MKCEKCGGLEVKVRETIYRKAEQTKGFRNKSSTPYVYRRRVCLSCGHRFTTREYTIPDLIAFGKQGYLEMIDDLEKNL